MRLIAHERVVGHVEIASASDRNDADLTKAPGDHASMEMAKLSRTDARQARQNVQA